MLFQIVPANSAKKIPYVYRVAMKFIHVLKMVYCINFFFSFSQLPLLHVRTLPQNNHLPNPNRMEAFNDQASQ